ncbi:BCCT family transporter [Halomonas aquamarina]|uniref:BCCT family transporter n=1 Tax=Vreelandella aquamarina TaxID=77097 RepID=A0ACC5VRJ0_9GAMM|nr:BCCT family transporter [Halomonas aquamarina]MBZ5486364.1 BCCT family transporter [Halomonas aquamarina]
MLNTLARRLGLRTDSTIFFTSAGIMVLFLVALLIAPDAIGEAFGAGREWVVTNLGWFFIFGVTSWVAFLLWAGISRYGAIRLGGNDAKPDYSNISWFTMLFAGGIGTVLMFWGVAEPISHFSTPPRPDVAPFSVEAADDAMSFSIYHLGLHTWAIFAMPGLAFAYFIYRYDLPMRFSSVFYPLLGERIYGPIGKTLDIFAVLGTLFGVAVSIGLGTQQINAGLTELFGVPDAVFTKVMIIVVLTSIAVGSIMAGLDSGIRRLSNLNIGMAVGLLLFVLFTGSTVFLLRAVVETFGLYITNLLPMAFWNDTLARYTSNDGSGWGWQGSWTVFYWAWTVTWSPFIGIFVARISRGRTIREFVFGVLFAPSIFTLVWFSIFGWSAMEIDGIGEEARAALGAQAGVLSAAVDESIPLAMFAFFDNFPAATLIQGLAVVIVAIFFATSSDSASLVVDMLCTGSPDPGPWHQRVFWGVSEGVLAAMLIVLAGDAGLTALQEVITVVGLPMFILVFVMMFSLLRGLSHEELVKVEVGRPPKTEELNE